MTDLLFITLAPGLLIVDLPFDSPFIRWAIGFWLVMFLINLVLGMIKRIPFL